MMLRGHTAYGLILLLGFSIVGTETTTTVTPDIEEEDIFAAENEGHGNVNAIGLGGGIDFLPDADEVPTDEESMSPEALAALQAFLQGTENGTILERLRRNAGGVVISAVEQNNQQNSGGIGSPNSPSNTESDTMTQASPESFVVTTESSNAQEMNQDPTFTTPASTADQGQQATTENIPPISGNTGNNDDGEVGVDTSAFPGVSWVQNSEITVKDEGQSRRKRFITKRVSTRWDKGVVPYQFNAAINEADKYSIKSAMLRYMTLTCIRFVPKDDSTKTKYGIDHDGVVEFIYGNGCYATNGNFRTLQHNSCCGKSTCVHELGHTLGLVHEHQSPIRTGKIRVNWENILQNLKPWFSLISPDFTESLVKYDITSTMHYTFNSFSSNGKPVMSELYRGPNYRSGKGDFYARKEISLAHDCKGLFCSSESLTCMNDGYMTLVRGQCACMCPDGLEPKSGCTQIKQKEKMTTWPKGTYSILKPGEGCPTGFKDGSITVHGSQTTKSTLFHLGNGYTGKDLNIQTCTREEDNGSDVPWEIGDYCIFRKGGSCPEGFFESFTQFGEPTPPITSGVLPDGTYDSHTRFQFCCRSDGFPDIPLRLPNTEPLVLFKYEGECQQIEGMAHIEEYFTSISGTAESLKVPGYGFSPKAPAKLDIPRYNLLGFYVCYYSPLTFDCGGVIELNSNHKQEEFTSPGYPNNYADLTQCTWLIKVPSGSSVKLEFSQFDVEASDDHCLDYVEVRQNMIGQPGVKYCGKQITSTLLSLRSTVLVTFRSNSENNRPGFKATASIVLPEDHVYDPADKGATYRGNVNFTHLFEPCIPWHEVKHCHHNTYSPSDMGHDLVENYCRNPSNDDAPWCYTNAVDCLRDYCDVSRLGRIHNNYDDCDDVLTKDPNFCSKDMAMGGCGVTCKDSLNIPPVEKKYTEVRCPAPDGLSDSTNDAQKSEYMLGESVTYKCKSGTDTFTRYCLSDGSWTKAKYVCGGCPIGWASFKNSCYKYFGTATYLSYAIKNCESLNGRLSSAKDKEEVDLVASLRDTMLDIWIGLSRKSDGWYWSDGTKAESINWRVQPPSYKSIAILKGQVNDRKIDYPWYDYGKYPYVCQYTPGERVICADRASNCDQLITSNPTVCTDNQGFARQECPFSCNICQTDAETTCPVPPAGENVVSTSSVVSLNVGKSVSYSCKSGFELKTGNLGRACLRSGKLSGDVPVCALKSSLITLNNNLNLIDRTHAGNWRAGRTGLQEHFKIDRDGEIIQWQFYSRTPGFTELMVWRPSAAGTTTTMTLIGHNLVQTRRNRIQHIDIPEKDRIAVKRGDLIGLWVMQGTGIPWDDCRGSYSVALNGWYNPNSFVTGNQYSFYTDNRCRMFSLRAKIGPKA